MLLDKVNCAEIKIEDKQINFEVESSNFEVRWINFEIRRNCEDRIVVKSKVYHFSIIPALDLKRCFCSSIK